AMEAAVVDDDPHVRAEGRRVLSRMRPDEALVVLRQALAHGETVERQLALATLADMKAPAPDEVLAKWLDKLLAGEVAPEIRLDLLEAAGRRSDGDLKERLAKYEAARPKNDHLANYREALVGGDPEAGRRVFYQKTETSCLRCHKIKGEGGEVG